MAAVDFKILSVTFASIILFFLYLFLGTIVKTRKQLYLSCLLLLSSAQATFAMHNNIAGPSSAQSRIHTQLGTEAMDRLLVNAYNRKLQEATQKGIIECSDYDLTQVWLRLGLINTSLETASNELAKQRLLKDKREALKDAINALDILDQRVTNDYQSFVGRELAEYNNNINIHEAADDNGAGIFDNNHAHTQNINVLAEANEVQVPQAEQQALIIDNAVNAVNNVDDQVSARMQLTQLMHNQEIQTDVSTVQDHDRALRITKLLELAQQHPHITAGAALAATAGVAYLLREPLAQLGVRAKSGATDIYRSLKSRIAYSNDNNSQLDENKLTERIQTAVLQLMASMSDQQLRQPGVGTLLGRAWQGRTAVLRSPYFNSLLRPDQKELLSALLLMHR